MSKFKEIISLWKQFLPLSVSDVSMAACDPLINTTMSILPAPEVQFAGLGVAKSISVFFESPIIMMLHASNSLAAKKDTSKPLWNFMLIWCFALTLCLTMINIPIIFSFLATRLFRLPQDIAASTHILTICLILWPAFIVWRRYFQGILIHFGDIKPIAQGGFLRVFVLAATLLLTYFLELQPALIAGLAMIFGVASESLFVSFYGWKYRTKLFNEVPDDLKPKQQGPKTLRELWTFYWPLAQTMVLVWGARAMLVVFIARSINPRVSLAVWPVAWALVVLFSNASRMVQQVVIKNRHHHRTEIYCLFGFSVGLSLSLCLFLMACSPVSTHLLSLFAGSDQIMIQKIRTVTLICSVVPLLVSVQNVLQGLLITEHKTKSINHSTLAGVSILLLGAWLGIELNISGEILAACSMVISLIAEILCLIFSIFWKNSQSFFKKGVVA